MLALCLQRITPGFGPEADPQFLYAPLVSYDEGGAEEALIEGDVGRVSWYSYAQACESTRTQSRDLTCFQRGVWRWL